MTGSHPRYAQASRISPHFNDASLRRRLDEIVMAPPFSTSNFTPQQKTMTCFHLVFL